MTRGTIDKSIERGSEDVMLESHTRDRHDVVEQRLHRHEVAVAVDCEGPVERSVGQHTEGDVRVDDVRIRAVDEVGKGLGQQNNKYDYNVNPWVQRRCGRTYIRT